MKTKIITLPTGTTAKFPKDSLLIIRQKGDITFKLRGSPITFNFIDMKSFDEELKRTGIFGLCVVLY